jgi:broad specificity phosphatase PhoE
MSVTPTPGAAAVHAGPTRWTFLRHGESRANAGGWLSGWEDVALTDTGRAQAVAAGEMLRGVHFSRCLVSDLGRARETARLVLDAAGQGRCALHVLPELRERDMGVLQREPWDAVRADGRHARWLAPWEVGPPGGESHAVVVARALAGLRAWDDGAPTLVVTHGSLLRGLLARLRGEAPDARLSVGNAVPEGWEGRLPPSNRS